MKKRNSIIVIVLCLLVFLGLGGNYYMGERKKDQEKELIEIERQSVIVLKKTFSDIKEVVVNKAGRNPSTGSYSIFVEMVDENSKSVKFSYIFSKERDEIDSYGIINEEVQKIGETNSIIKVIFTDGSEEEI